MLSMNKRAIMDDEIGDLLGQDIFYPQYQAREDKNSFDVGMKLIFPKEDLTHSYVKIISNKTNMTIYRGFFFDKLIFAADDSLLGKGMFLNDGMDSLYISIVDKVNMLVYSCEQQHPEIIWKKNTIASIIFFEHKKYDKKTRIPRYYSVELNSGLDSI